ncbi:GntR family transcriptional regulator YhfZ [Photobacterium rosenbergii]|uniref:GntR family transcriptional regulator YhfZ n=1 Tax=Photobacterium rosenbergii TaxID=294936 RepID=A0ABU3ZKS2_9GAMM|nr:GntR family transcriptional regulator YhfZ [Photobacterium rosenbergii]MDV5170690.1 GntR family transcriptional regulator YhfZ [Photobacterium rosenbergii]
MRTPYISKEGAAIINIARYLMSTTVNDRLRTIDALSEDIGVSVGFVQKALTTIEQQDAVRLSKQGRNGTFISKLDYRALAKLTGFSHIVCAMPLPYTKHYEGLASGLKQQIGDLPLYFAHMRGAGVRAECLLEGTHDIAIMSKLAAQTYSGGVVTAIDLGQYSYSHPHRLIFRQGEYDKIKFVGVDPDSPDQKLLTQSAFEDKPVTVVEINYADSMNLLLNGEIDAVVWLPEAIDMEKYGLAERPLDHIEQCRLASEAVMLVSGENPHITTLLRKLINIPALLDHQQQVVRGDITPNY